jgi:hypothetical protein
MKSKDASGTRYSLEIEAGIVREPFNDVVQKIREAVSKYKNNFSVKTDGTLSTSETEQISKITITVEIFTR